MQSTNDSTITHKTKRSNEPPTEEISEWNNNRLAKRDTHYTVYKVYGYLQSFKQ